MVNKYPQNPKKSLKLLSHSEGSDMALPKPENLHSDPL